MEQATTYEINFSVSFWGKGNPDSAYPDEDKAWFDVYLDERWHYDDGYTALCTFDWDGFQLPLEFLAWPREKREAILPDLLEKAVPLAAQMLERYGIDEYEVHANVDVMDIDYQH